MVKRISEIKNKYGSYAELLKVLPYLCKSASATEFKEELSKFSNSLEMPIKYFLSENDENNIPLLFHILQGYDYIRKTDWLLGQIPKERFQEHYFNFKNPVTKETIADVITDTPGLQEVFEKHGFIFTEWKGIGYKTSTFEWNGFTILNAGFHPVIMKEVLEELQPSVDRIKKFGFGKVLYNPVIFVSSPMEGHVKNELQQNYEKIKAGGFYNIPKDQIVLRSEYWGQKNITPKTFVHELGHRFYYKFLSETQRQRWQQHFKDRQIVITEQKIRDLKKVILSCAPVIKDIEGTEDFPDFSRFNYAQFTHKLRKNPEIKEVVDFIVEFYAEDKSKNIKTKRREYFAKIFNPSEFYNLAWAGKILPLLIKTMETQKLTPAVIQVSKGEKIPVEIWSKYKIDELEMPDKETAMYFAKVESRYLTCISILQHWAGGWNYFVGKTIKLSHSSSKYGENNPQEDYAEAFEHFIHNKEMPVDIYKEFVNIHNIRLGKKTAKLTPTEEMQIEALQKRIDTLYHKKNYEEAENLEEKLETLLNELEAREEHFNIESDESEDFYGWKNRLTERPNLVPDLDDENSNPSLEEELAKLYYSWITDDGRCEDNNARKDWMRNHPGSTWQDVPREIQQSKSTFLDIFNDMIGDTYPSHMDDNPRKDITFEEAFAAAKDAYETVTKRRDRVRKLLKKADFQSDRYYQQLAVSAFESVQDILKTEAARAEREFEEYLDRGLNPPEFISDYLIQNPYYEGYELRAAEVGIPENQYPLIFIFGTKKKIPNPALGFTKQGKAVILFNNLKEPYHLTYAYSRLDKATFIHEFIHYLDMGRGNKETNNSFQGSPEEKDLQEYYNNPKEMNAYYQENIPSLYKIVESMVKNNYEPLTEVISSGYEAFFKFAIKFFNARWWDYLTPENKRRVQKRLYAVFENLKEKYK